MYPITSVSIGGDLTLTGDAQFFAPPTTTVTGAFLQSAGTFTGHSTGSLDFDSTVTLNGGTFSASLFTNVDGAFAVGGGAFTGHSTGALKVGGNFSVTSGSFTPSASNFLTGTYSQSAGTFTGGATSFVVGSDFSISSTATFTVPWFLSVGGNFSRSNTPTFTQSTNNVILTAATSRSHSFGGITFAGDLLVTDAVTLSSGLLAYWKMDETAGTSVNDETATNADLTYGGTPLPDYRMAPVRTTNTRGIDLGLGDYLEKTTTPASMDVSTYSLAAWIQPDAIDDGNGNCGAGTDNSEIVSIGDNYLLRLCGSTGATAVVSIHMRSAPDSARAATRCP